MMTKGEWNKIEDYFGCLLDVLQKPHEIYYGPNEIELRRQEEIWFLNERQVTDIEITCGEKVRVDMGRVIITFSKDKSPFAEVKKFTDSLRLTKIVCSSRKTKTLQQHDI